MRRHSASLDKAIAALPAGTTLRAKTAKIIIEAFGAGIQLHGDPVGDWQLARARLHGSNELEEIFAKARLLRLFKATDVLAWALIDVWNGRDAYIDAAAAARRVLANEALEASQMEPVPISLMNMHKSKGKEFDAVIIAEGRYGTSLLDPTWNPTRNQAARRLLRVAITRARHYVILVRPIAVTPLTG